VIPDVPPEVRSAAPGIAGSLLALFFLSRPPVMMAGVFLGGCSLSFFATQAVAEFVAMEKYPGLVGFLLGMFGMVLVAKAYDTIEALKPTEFADAIRDWVRKRLGVDK
jgi:hypothetical protein